MTATPRPAPAPHGRARRPLRLVVVRDAAATARGRAHPAPARPPRRRRPPPGAPSRAPAPELPQRTPPRTTSARRWSSRTDLPDPGDAGRRLITLTLEAIAGRRPLAQLRPLTSRGVFAALSGGRRPRWCAEGTSPLLVGQVHVCEPVDGVAEVSAVARRDGRAHAVAARLEGIDGRWRCTALQIG